MTISQLLLQIDCHVLRTRCNRLFWSGFSGFILFFSDFNKLSWQWQTESSDCVLTVLTASGVRVTAAVHVCCLTAFLSSLHLVLHLYTPKAFRIALEHFLCFSNSPNCARPPQNEEAFHWTSRCLWPLQSKSQENVVKGQKRNNLTDFYLENAQKWRQCEVQLNAFSATFGRLKP